MVLPVMLGAAFIVGLRILHEVFARTSTGQSALPGFDTVEDQTSFYETIVAEHWSLLAGWLQHNPNLDHSGETLQVVDRSKHEAELV